MNGGDGLHSYAKNSFYQGSSIDSIKFIIEDEINTKLDINALPLHSPNCFRAADFGCSTGHNSFRTMKIIVDAVEKKFIAEGVSTNAPEFHVLFNDKEENDFNTLFNALPPQRNYHAAGLPGSFHTQILPKASLHFAHSSWSLHWLSQVPKAVADSTSVAWNKGNIHYEGSRKEVLEAYLNQYDKDITSFLDARAQELVGGGLMTLLVPAVPALWNPDTSHVLSTRLRLLGSCLLDMANEGIVNEVEIDSLNIPIYVPNPQELNTIIERNSSFTIERMEILTNLVSLTRGRMKPNAVALRSRAALEGTLRKKFDIGIIDELFARFEKKIASLPMFFAEHDKTIMIFAVLRRNK